MKVDLTGLIQKTQLSLSKVTIYRNILRDEIVDTYCQLIKELNDPTPVYEELIDCYHHLTGLLMHKYAVNQRIYGDLWQHHIIDLILTDENIFSLACERGLNQEISDGLWNTMRYDLKHLQTLFKLNGKVLHTILRDKTSIETWPCWEINTAAAAAPDIIQSLLLSSDWADESEHLADFYFRNGCGIFNKFKAFRWNRQNTFSSLVGIEKPDPISLEYLIGYENEREEVIANTLQFIHGLPCNNVLLYGDRGTGKSATVKALLNEYGDKKLRLIEVSKYHLNDLPQIMDMLQNRGMKYIIFVDDLSFEGDETSYRELKSILEGGIEVRPQNVLIYATSNRRHLIKEYFSERSSRDEIGSQDTLQEKLSLSDRFGITITFSSPDQEKYLLIVEGLAKQRNIDIDIHHLKREALIWEMRHNGRSPRTARQFIDHLEGQLKLKI
jgi:predicted AAA+ superfamily ATPase